MANIVSDQTEISFAESVTNWSGDTFVLESESKVQGSNSLATIQTQNGANLATFTPASALDMTGSHIRMAFNSSIIGPNGDTEAADGVEVVLTHTNGTARFTIAGSDTYKGGWQDYFFDVHATPTSGTAYTTGTVSVITLQINTSSKPRNTTNGWYDNWRFGNGLTINSTAAEAIDFTDVAIADVALANAWGILQDTKGVLFGRGKLTLGSTGSLNCNLVSSGETIYFEDENVASDLYGIITQEGTGATDIDISGMTCKTVGATGAEMDFSTTITSCSITGSSFTGMGTISFYSGATIQANTFTSCGTIAVNGCTFENIAVNSGATVAIGSGTITSCTFNSSTSASAVTATSLSNIVTSTFVSDGSSHAVDIGTVSSNTSMSWGSTSSGYTATDGNQTFLVNVNSGITLTINNDSGDTLFVKNTGTGTVSIVTGQRTKTFNLSPVPSSYEYRIYTVTALGSLAGATEVQGTETTTASSQAYTYSYAANTYIAFQVLDKSVTYQESITFYELEDASTTTTISLEVDTND